MKPDSRELFNRVNNLCNAWCDRRCLVALRYLLKGWPLASPLTDSWGDLAIALKDVRAFARHELIPQELADVEEIIRDVDRIVYRT